MGFASRVSSPFFMSFFSSAAAAATHEQAVVKNVPPPAGPTGGPLRALIYDSVYDEYKVWCEM